MDTLGKLELSASLQEIPVTLTSNDGTENEFVIRELTGEQRDAYLDQMSKRFKFDAKGQVQGVSNFKGLHMSLLKLCLVDSSTNKLVSDEFLKSLPSTAMSKLFEAASKLSALDQEAEDEVKND